MRAKECMCKNVVCANPETTVSEVAKLMEKRHVGSIPVCKEDGKIVGIVTDRDIVLRSIANDKNPTQTPISDIMTTKVIRTTEDTDVEAIAGIMSDNQVRRIPVVEDEKVIGMITLANLAQYHSISNKCLCDTVEGICHTRGQDVKNAE